MAIALTFPSPQAGRGAGKGHFDLTNQKSFDYLSGHSTLMPFDLIFYSVHGARARRKNRRTFVPHCGFMRSLVALFVILWDAISTKNKFSISRLSAGWTAKPAAHLKFSHNVNCQKHLTALGRCAYAFAN
ncbi:MAG: hypothetical protein Q8N39_08155 [Pelolinea sp.]|nr:hypothetical protein [Pelolinea sp.]